MNIITPRYQNLSLNKNLKGQKQNKLNKSADSVSFRGAPEVVTKEMKTLVTGADKALMDVFSKHYGDIGTSVGEKLGKLASETIAESGDKTLGIVEKAGNKLLQKSSRFVMEQGTSSIKEKSFVRSLTESVIFPFVNLPLYGVNWVVGKAKSIPGLKNGAEKLYKSPVLRVPRKLNEMDWKTDSLKGIMDKTKEAVGNFAKESGTSYDEVLQKLSENNPVDKEFVQKADEHIKENLYKVSNKFFDKHTGNFNTAYERPLNRIVTGLIPVAFLANDAYNLSVLCGDKKEDSKKEANERKQQEITRVLTTAYIQLLTFGAFTKQVNTKPWFTPLTSALTVLFSETNSRVKNGKPIFFLSSEKAKEYNQNKDSRKGWKNLLFRGKKADKSAAAPAKIETSEKSKEEAKDTKTDTTASNSAIKNNSFVAANTPGIFTSFKAADKDEDKTTETKENKETKEVKNDKKADKKGKKDSQKALINFKTFKKGVMVLTAAGVALSFLKNSSYTKNSALMKGVRKVGDFFKQKVYNPLAFKDFSISTKDFEQVTKSLEDIGCGEIAEGHKFIQGKYGKNVGDGIIKMYKTSLSSSKVPNVVTGALDALKGAGAQLSEQEAKTLNGSIKTAIKLNQTAISEGKFDVVAKKAQSIIEKKQINLTKEQAEVFKQSVIDAMSANSKKAPIQVETKLKPFVDIVTQPFKFIWSAARLPFKLASSMVNLAVAPVEKKAAQAELGEATLNNVEKNIHKVVTEIFGEKKAKSGKISQTVFANAMEELGKKTAPYRNAKAALDKLVESGASSEQIAKAQEAVDKSKTKLSKYVYEAVEKSFNGVTQSSNKNTDLAMMSKLASSTVTSAFLVADNYNMVMLKSDGENKEEAKEKANERIVQRLSALFYQTLFINWFNSTFRSTYNSSLKGMTAVAIPNTLTTEILTRKSIGMPVGRKTLEELEEIDDKNEKRTGFAGKYFKFMRLLTGKKPLKDRLPKDKQAGNAAKTETSQTSSTTNLLEKFSKK